MAVNFKSELLPVFSYPVSSWAKHIRFVLLSMNLCPTAHNVSKVVIPYVIAKIPVSLLSLVPTGYNLDAVLRFLESYDNDVTTPATILSGNLPLTERPSIAFHQTQERLRGALSDGTPEDTIKELVWATIRRQLPDSLQSTVHIIPIIGAPTAAQFKMIDEAWAAASSLNFSASVVAASQPSSTETLLKQLLDRVSKIELNMAAGCTSKNNVPNNSQHTQLDTYKQINYKPNNNKYTQKQDSNTTNTTNLCWYHAKYGKKALKCVVPCDYAHLNP